MPIDNALLEILACPEDKGPLYYVESESFLYNPRLHRKYAVRDNIPVMLINEAEAASASEHERIMALIASSGVKPTFSE